MARVEEHGYGPPVCVITLVSYITKVCIPMVLDVWRVVVCFWIYLFWIYLFWIYLFWIYLFWSASYLDSSWLLRVIKWTIWRRNWLLQVFPYPVRRTSMSPWRLAYRRHNDLLCCNKHLYFLFCDDSNGVSNGSTQNWELGIVNSIQVLIIMVIPL